MKKSTKSLLKSDFNKPKVRVFTTPACPYCYTLKEFLKEKNIAFEELDVSRDKVAREEMEKKTLRLEVPVIDIGGEFMVGFDKEKIDKLLNL